MKKKIIPMVMGVLLAVPSLAGAEAASTESSTSRAQLEAEVISKLGISSEFATDLTDTDLNKFLKKDPVNVTNKEQYFRVVSTKENQESNPQARSFASSDNSPIVTEITKEQAEKEVVAAKSESSGGGISTQAVNDSDTTSTDWIRLETNMTMYNTNGQVSSRFTFLKEASYKGTDVLGIALSQGMAPLNNTASFTHKTDYYNPATMKWTEYTESAANATITYHAGGASAQFNLFKPAYQYRDERGYLTFEVAPRTSTNWGSGIYDIRGTHAHQSRSFSGSVGVSIPLGASLSVSPTTSFTNVDTFVQIQYP
ncbi:hypothetical protein [Saccharibacillus sp. JS10]|uniref:hypothetical protein n=1 Tax=Saccharibacillus sp. JS10 TaxID=2950552 RepID=UPI00210EF4F3|nr:hypothetical protein [Saccharibacillus sp. JS10]MCQ4086570.1 hypothetical protein [Saccharibacillus sp. JS10]